MAFMARSYSWRKGSSRSGPRFPCARRVSSAVSNLIPPGLPSPDISAQSVPVSMVNNKRSSLLEEVFSPKPKILSRPNRPVAVATRRSSNRTSSTNKPRRQRKICISPSIDSLISTLRQALLINSALIPTMDLLPLVPSSTYA